MKDASTARGLIALGAVLLIWSGITVVLKHLAGLVDPWSMIGVRYTAVTLVLAPLLWQASRRSPHRIPWKAALIPALIYAPGQILWNIAPYHNPAALIMFIGRCAFFFSAVAGFTLLASERWLLRKRLFWAGFAVIVLGLGLLFAEAIHADDSSEINLKGVLIMTATAACWGCYGVTLKRWLPGVPARIGFPLISLLTWPVLFGGFLIWGDVGTLQALTGNQWALLIGSGLVSIGLGQFLSYVCIQTIGPIVSEGSYNVIPFTSAAIAWWWLGESLTPLQWSAGCAIIAGSLCLLIVRARR